MRSVVWGSGIGVVLGLFVACEGDIGGESAATETGSTSTPSGGSQGTAGGATGGNSGNGGSDTGGSTGAGGMIPPGTPLDERLSVTDVTAPAGVKSGVSSWRIWGTRPLGVAPVFTVPLANCDTLVGYTTGSGNGVTARVAHLDSADQLVETFELGAFELRGLAAEPDGHFGALLWDDAGDRIYVSRHAFDGTELFQEELTNATNVPDDFGIGDSRLEYGDGRYGAYYHVHSDSGHEGDTLKWVDAATGDETTGWSWGCSHSMSNLLRYNPADTAFMPACVTDCYPGTSGMPFSAVSIGGIYINHDDHKVMDVDAGCNGDVAGELGGAALAPSGWVIAFNAHQNAATAGQGSYDVSSMNQDIAIATVASNHTPGSVVWLTSTPTVDEADASIVRWVGGDGEEYVVGWSEGGTTHRLARIDRTGTFLEGPIDVTAHAKWGRRDDPFRANAYGDVMWAWFDGAGDTTLHVARLAAGAAPTCASF